jgi:hypothetical protein
VLTAVPLEFDSKDQDQGQDQSNGRTEQLKKGTRRHTTGTRPFQGSYAARENSTLAAWCTSPYRPIPIAPPHHRTIAPLGSPLQYEGAQATTTTHARTHTPPLVAGPHP